MTQPEIGRMSIKHGLVVWELTPDEAREIADFEEESLDNPKDLAHKDVAALRYWANSIDNKDRDQ